MSNPIMSFRPKPEVAEAIKAAARKDRRPPAQYLANLVEDALAAQQQPARQDVA